jgi:hypothetical protein
MSGSKVVAIGKKSFVNLTFEEKTLATPGVNFINVLRAAFAWADPKAQKKTENLSDHFISLQFHF